MLVLVFISLGLIAGYIAVRLFKSTGRRVLLDLGFGASGAIAAGSVFNHLAATTVAGVTTTIALVSALTGAAALLATFHGLCDRRYLRRART